MKEDKITKRIKELQSDTKFTFKLTEDIIDSIYRIAVEDCTLEKKDLDMICANNLKTKGAGFAADTNAVTIITKDGIEKLELMSKQKVAEKIFDKIIDSMNKDVQ